MSLRILGVTLVLVSLSLTAEQAMGQGKEANKAAAEKDPMGYFLGISVGQNMAQNGFTKGDFDLQSLLAGVSDGLEKLGPALSAEELQKVQSDIETLLKKRQDELLAVNKEKGDLWLKENSKKDGVKLLEGGVQYKVLKAGKGASPAAADTVKVHYTGTLTNGTEFDSSVKRGKPAEFRVDQVIKGWQMALQKMKVGDKWMLYIPSDLAYGERGSRGAIGPNEVLVFEVELLDII